MDLNDIIFNEETGLKAILAEQTAKLNANLKDQSDEREDRAAENAAYQKNVHNLVDAEAILKKATRPTRWRTAPRRTPRRGPPSRRPGRLLEDSLRIGQVVHVLLVRGVLRGAVLHLV